MSSVPWQQLGIDLNGAVSDPDLDDDLLGTDLKQPVLHPVAHVYLNNRADPDGVKEDVFDLNKPFCWDVSEEDEEEAPWEPDLNEAHACKKDTSPGCEPDINLNESTNNRQEVLLPDLNEIPVRAPRTSRKHYSDETKRAVYMMLLEGSGDGRLPDGLTNQVSLAMDVSLRCVQRIWKAGQTGGGIHAVGNKKANCGRKRIDISPEAIAAIPLKDRTTLEDVARHLRIAKSTIFRRVKEGRIERHSIGIHPLMRNEDKRSHAQYHHDMLEPHRCSPSGIKSTYNATHIGKKWFNRTNKSNKKFYCAPGEKILKEQ